MNEPAPRWLFQRKPTYVELIRRTLQAKPLTVFRPNQIAAIVDCPEDTVRQTLKRLARIGEVIHDGYAAYRWALRPEHVECSCHH